MRTVCTRLLLLLGIVLLVHKRPACECLPQRGDVDEAFEYETELDAPALQSQINQHWTLLGQIGQALNHIADSAKEKSQRKSEMAEAVNALTSAILASNNRLDDQIIALRQDTNRQMDAAVGAARRNEKQIMALLEDAKDTQSVVEDVHQSVMDFKQNVMEQAHVNFQKVPKDTLASSEEPMPECPDKYIGIGRECYRMELVHSKNWFEAREICQQEGSDLAMPEDLNLFKTFIADDVKYRDTDFWLGASDLNQEGIWRWLSGKEMDHAWDEDQPDGSNKENCMEIRLGQKSRLHDYYCYNEQNFICQSNVGPFSSNVEPPILDCPEGYFQLETQCFRVVDSQALSWDAARSFCRDQGGDLAQPQDPQALRHLLFTNNLYTVWVGATSLHGPDRNWTWVSGNEMSELVEGDTVNDYDYDYDEDRKVCLLMKTEFRPFFHSFDCDETYSFVCQRSGRPVDKPLIAKNVNMKNSQYLREDNRCGNDYPAPNGREAECDPMGDSPCCSKSGKCGNTPDHCMCHNCTDYRVTWLPTYECGLRGSLSNGEPAQCNPRGIHPCCSDAGWCGESRWHCDCPTCIDYREISSPTPSLAGCGEIEIACEDNLECVHKGKRCNGHRDCSDGSDEFNCDPNREHKTKAYEVLWLPNYKCGSSASLPNGDSAQCNPHGIHPCCSDGGWCGDSSQHCYCPTCVDYRDKYTAEPTAAACGDEEYACRNFYCVHKRMRCDGNTDCSDGSDEERCAVCDPPCENGECTGPDTCVCDGGFTGDLCDEEEYDESGVCEYDCRPHGRCKGGECLCDDAWNGPWCDLIKCDPKCEEHGQCENGTCICMKGWNGRHCTLPPASLNSTCTLDPQCKQTDEKSYCEPFKKLCMCVEGFKAMEYPGLGFNCVEHDGNWNSIRNACIKSNNYQTFTTLTIDACKEKCVEEDDIVCQSIEYNSADRTCSISEARSNSDDFTEPCHINGWEYVERVVDAAQPDGIGLHKSSPTGSPEKPHRLKVLDKSGRAVELSWAPPYDGNSPITRYIVEYKHTKHNWEQDGERIMVPGDQNVAAVFDLLPATPHQFRIVARNEMGDSQPSDAVIVITQEEAPSGPPRNMRIEVVDQHSLRVTWKPPKKEERNGDIQGYYVGYRLANSSKPYLFETVEASKEMRKKYHLIILQLELYTEYAVIVQSFNRIGQGPRTDEVRSYTAEGTPQMPPQDVTCTTLTSLTIRVSWSSPPFKSVKGVIEGYKVIYGPTEVWYDEEQRETKFSGYTERHLHWLQKYTDYTIEVLAYTNGGEGVRSEPIHCQTDQDIPDPPAGIKALVTTSESILVSWLPPNSPNGIITQYTVYYKEYEGTDMPLTQHKVLPTQSYFDAVSLKKQVDYVFWVTASTIVGEGDSSESVHQKPSHLVPAKIASFEKEYLGTYKKDIILNCLSVGHPSPDVSWTLQGEPLESGSDYYHLRLIEGSLLIREVLRYDAGEYTCRVKNPYGTDTVTHTLLIQAPPHAPEIQMLSTTNRSIKVKLRPSINETIPIHGYTIYYKAKFSDWESVQVLTSSKHYTLEGLWCGSQYQVYANAYNKIGTSESSELLNIRTAGNKPEVPAVERFVEESSTSITLHLDAWGDGGCPINYFVPEYKSRNEVNWTIASNRVRAGGNYVLMELTPATLYNLRITAHNNAGSSVFEHECYTLTITGDVVDTSGPTEVTEVVGPERATVGQKIQLMCKRSSATSEFYSLKWYKDDQEIFRYMPGSSHPMKTWNVPGISIDINDSNADVLVLLDVTKKASGNYRCELSLSAPAFFTSAAEMDLTVDDM